MGIALSTKTEHKQALKLYNQICTYLFEQEYGELKYANSSNIKVLKDAQEVLSMIISKAK